MLSKLFLVFLMSFVFITTAKAGEGRDGPFPMLTAAGIWQAPNEGLKVEITNGKLSRDQRFMPVTVTVYAIDGSVFAQGAGLHYMLDSNLSVLLRDTNGRKMSLLMTPYYGEDKHPFPGDKYQLVMSIGYVYEKDKSVEFLRR